MMKTYYYNNGSNEGPVTQDELATLFDQGVINENTYILEKGTKEWLTYKSVFPAKSPLTFENLEDSKVTTPEPAVAPTPTPEPAVTPASTPASTSQFNFKKLKEQSHHYADVVNDFDLNGKIDSFLRRFIKLPTLFSDSDKLARYFTLAGNVTCLLGWISFIVWGAVENPFNSIILSLLVTIIGGGILQKILYHFYKIGSASLIVKKIELPSLDFPKILAMLAFMLGIVLILGLFKAPLMILACTMLTLALSLFLVGIFGVNAEQLNATRSKEKLATGLTVINVIRYYIHTCALAAHIITPVCVLLIITGFVGDAIGKSNQKFGSYGSVSQATYSRNFSSDESLELRNYANSSYVSRRENSGSSLVLSVTKSVHFYVFICPFFGVLLFMLLSVPLDILANLLSFSNRERRNEDKSLD